MMKLRSEHLIKTVEGHHLKGALAAILDITEEFCGAAEHSSSNSDLSPSGRAKAMQANLRSALRNLRDARAPIVELKSKLAAKKEAVKIPPFDKKDTVGFLRRQELRAALKAMPLTERTALLTGQNASTDFVDAALEQHPVVSGFALNPMELGIFATVKEDRLKTLFNRELAEISELENTIGEAEMIADTARVDIADRSGMQQNIFEAFAKPIEERQNAPWLIKDGAKITVVDLSKRGTNEMYREATPEEVRDGKTYSNEQEYLADRKSA